MGNVLRGYLSFIAGALSAITLGFLIISAAPYVVVPEIRLKWEPPAAQLLPDKTYCGDAAICLTGSDASFNTHGWTISNLEIDAAAGTITGTCPKPKRNASRESNNVLSQEEK